MIQPGRMLLKEGNVIQIELNAQQATKVYLFLFNDIVMLSKQTSVRKNLLDHTLKYDFKSNLTLLYCEVADYVPDNTVK